MTTLKQALKQGLTEEQAKSFEDQADVIDQVRKNLQVENESKYLATKEDVTKVEVQIVNLRAELKGDINKLLYWLIGIGVTIVLAIIFKKQ